MPILTGSEIADLVRSNAITPKQADEYLRAFYNVPSDGTTSTVEHKTDLGFVKKLYDAVYPPSTDKPPTEKDTSFLDGARQRHIAGGGSPDDLQYQWTDSNGNRHSVLNPSSLPEEARVSMLDNVFGKSAFGITPLNKLFDAFGVMRGTPLTPEECKLVQDVIARLTTPSIGTSLGEAAEKAALERLKELLRAGTDLLAKAAAKKKDGGGKQ